MEWTKDLIENNRALLRNGSLNGSYGKKYVDMIYKLLQTKMPVVYQHVLVIGSQVNHEKKTMFCPLLS